MTIAYVQHKKAQVTHSASPPASDECQATFDSPPTPGNLIVIGAGYQSGLNDMTPDAGCTAVPGTPLSCDYRVGLFYRKAQVGDGSTWGWLGTGGTGRTVFIAEFSGVWGPSPLLTQNTNCAGSIGHLTVSLSPTAGKSILVIASCMSDADSSSTSWVADSGYAMTDQYGPDFPERPNSGLFYKIVPSTSGTEVPGVSFGSATIGIVAAAFGEAPKARNQALIV